MKQTNKDLLIQIAQDVSCLKNETKHIAEDVTKNTKVLDKVREDTDRNTSSLEHHIARTDAIQTLVEKHDRPYSTFKNIVNFSKWFFGAVITVSIALKYFGVW